MGFQRLVRRLTAAGLGAAPAALVVLAPGTAQAQVSTREEVLRLPAPLRAAASEFGAEACPQERLQPLAEGEAPLATLSSLTVAEGGALPAAVLAGDWNDLIGRPLSREGFARIAARAECRYRERGFVFARAAVSGDAASGAYTLRMREGVVSSLEVATGDDALAGAVLRAFRGVREGAPLNAADVRRGLANVASIGVTNVRPTVRRARADPDAIDLILVVEPPPNQLFVQAQNYNIEPLGPWGALVGVRVQGLTPLYERSALGLYLAEDGEKQQALQASSEALLTRSGLKARVEAAYALARPGDALAPLDVEGETAFFSAELAHPLVVRRGLIGAGRVSLEAIEQETTFLGDRVLNNDHLRVVQAGVRLDGLWRGLVWGAGADVRKGLSALGASARGDRNLSRGDADPEATLLRIETEATTKVGAAGSVRVAARGQHADTSLPAFEEFNFGALSGGRGFDPAVISGDRGVALTAEFATRPLAVGDVVAGQPYVFVDAARAWNEGAALVRRADGVSAGIGVRADVLERARIDLTYAEPVGNVRGIPRSVAGPRLMVQLSASFDWTFANGFRRQAP
jgi:hemolysin activation/secretion protein